MILLYQYRDPLPIRFLAYAYSHQAPFRALSRPHKLTHLLTRCSHAPSPARLDRSVRQATIPGTL